MSIFPTSSKTVPPPGNRPPPPPTGPRLRLLAWVMLISASLLLWFAEPITAWAEAEIAPPSELEETVVPILPIPTLPQLAAHALLRILAPDIRERIELGVSIGYSIIGIEVLVLMMLPLLQEHNRQRMHHRTLRIRALAEEQNPARDTDLLRTLHAILPINPLAALIGCEPSIGLILHGRPGQTVELRIHLRAPSERDINALDDAIRTAIIGHTPGCVIEPLPAPHIVEDARYVWQSFRMSGPRELPLRILADAKGDPLAALAAALRPSHSDIMTAELHLWLRPLRGWALSSGWRAAGLRRLLRLQQRADHVLSPDARRLEARLAAPAFAAALDLHVRARGNTADGIPDALLQKVRAALDIASERTGPWRQSIVIAGGGRAANRRGQKIYQRSQLRPAMSISLPRLLLPLPQPQPALILSIDELVCFWHLPTIPIADLVDRLRNRYIQAPVHALFGIARPREAIALGEARGPDGVLRQIGLLLSDLRYVLHATAGMGAGKSRLLANLIRQFRRPGFCLIDGKGDDLGGLSEFILNLIPIADEHRIIMLDPRDARWPIGINPLSGIDLQQPGAADLAVANIFSLFARIDPETWGAAQGMKDFLDKGLRLVLSSEAHPTLAHVKQALLDPNYRSALLERCRNRDVVDYWTIVFPKIGEGQKSSRDALLRRFDKMLSADLLRLMVSQPQPALNFGDAITDKAMLIIPIPNVGLGDLAGVYSMLIFQQFLRAAFARPGDDQTRADYPLIVDELQVLIAEAANDDIETALSRLRSFAIPLIIAHQSLSQLGPVEPLVHINAENRIILKTREPDAGIYARQYTYAGLTSGDIINQDPNLHQYAILRCNGQPAGPFSISPLPWPQPINEPVPPYNGIAWQEIMPTDVGANLQTDLSVAEFLYAEPDSNELNRRAEQLALMPDEEFGELLARWEAIRNLQLVHINRFPGCIPDKRERIRWRVRLRYGMPYVLAEAIYRRSRPAIAPEAPTEGRKRSAAGATTAAAGTQAVPPEPPAFTQADRSPPAPPQRGPLFPREDDDG